MASDISFAHLLTKFDVVKDAIFAFLPLKDLTHLRRCNKQLKAIVDSYSSKSTNQLLQIALKEGFQIHQRISFSYAVTLSTYSHVSFWSNCKESYHQTGLIASKKQKRTSPTLIGTIFCLKTLEMKQVKATRAELGHLGEFTAWQLLFFHVIGDKIALVLSDFQISWVLVFDNGSLFAHLRIFRAHFMNDMLVTPLEFAKNYIEVVSLTHRENESEKLASVRIKLPMEVTNIACIEDNVVIVNCADEENWQNQIYFSIQIENNFTYLVKEVFKPNNQVVKCVLKDVALVEEEDKLKLIWFNDATSTDMMSLESLKSCIGCYGARYKLSRDEVNENTFVVNMYLRGPNVPAIKRSIFLLITNRTLLKKINVDSFLGTERDVRVFNNAFFIQLRLEKFQALDLKNERLFELVNPSSFALQTSRFYVDKEELKLWSIEHDRNDTYFRIISWSF